MPFFGGWYEWGGVRFVPSWGGSMFEALMPTLVLDEPRHAPASLGANDAAHATRAAALRARDARLSGVGHVTERDAAGDGYGEYGVRVLGSLGYPRRRRDAARLARSRSPSPPAEAIANLRRLAERYDVYGDFGFYDAVDPVTRRRSRTPTWRSTSR